MTQETEAAEEGNKILSTIENGIGRLTFNNPQRRNAMSLEMWETTLQTLEAFDQELKQYLYLARWYKRESLQLALLHFQQVH